MTHWSGRRERACLVEQRLGLGDPRLRLLLVKSLAIKRRRTERGLDLPGEVVALGRQVCDRCLDRLVARLVRAVQRLRRRGQEVEPELAERRVDLLVYVAKPQQGRAMRDQTLRQRLRLNGLD